MILSIEIVYGSFLPMSHLEELQVILRPIQDYYLKKSRKFFSR